LKTIGIRELFHTTHCKPDAPIWNCKTSGLRELFHIQDEAPDFWADSVPSGLRELFKAKKPAQACILDLGENLGLVRLFNHEDKSDYCTSSLRPKMSMEYRTMPSVASSAAGRGNPVCDALCGIFGHEEYNQLGYPNAH
jgi:hypothetical protein